MNQSDNDKPSFDPPSILFRFEDLLRTLYGGPLLYNDFIRKMDLQGDEHVLDFGCGGGIEARCVVKQLSSKGHVSCLDPSEYLLNRAKRRLQKFPNVTFYNQDIRDAELPEETFDAAIILYVLHDIPKADRRTILVTLNRTLKSDGKIFIQEPTRADHGIPVPEIRELFKSAGLIEKQSDMLKAAEYWGTFQAVDKPMD